MLGRKKAKPKRRGMISAKVAAQRAQDARAKAYAREVKKELGKGNKQS